MPTCIPMLDFIYIKIYINYSFFRIFIQNKEFNRCIIYYYVLCGNFQKVVNEMEIMYLAS